MATVASRSVSESKAGARCESVTGTSIFLTDLGVNNLPCPDTLMKLRLNCNNIGTTAIAAFARRRRLGTYRKSHGRTGNRPAARSGDRFLVDLVLAESIAQRTAMDA